MSTPARHGDDRATSPWLLVLGREVAVRLRDRSFIVSTALTLLIILGCLVVPTLLDSGSTRHTVAVLDAPGAQVIEQAETVLQGTDDSATVTAQTVGDRAAAEQAVRNGDVDAALVGTQGTYELLSEGGSDPILEAALSETVRTSALSENAAAAGTTLQEITAGTALTPVDLAAQDGGLPAGTRFLVGMVFAMLFYMAAMLFGVQIANSVVEEKQSRIVEILAAMIPVRQLLIGKVLGNTLIAFVQIALIAATALVGMTFTDLDMALPGIVEALAWYIPFFVLGFLALACLWAAAGALSSRTEDIQSTSMPLTMVLVLVIVVAPQASGTLREVLSYVPISSTVLMPMRIIDGEVSWWQPLLALGLVLALCALTIWLGARLYERALLHTQGSLTWRKALTMGD